MSHAHLRELESPAGPDHPVHVYFRPQFAISLVRNVLSFLDRHYFRSRWVGFEGWPARNNPNVPLIFIGNHSGMAFPWDAMIFLGRLLRASGYDFTSSCRPLVAPALSRSPIMSPFFLPDFCRRAGGVDASLENFEALIGDPGASVMIYPEGIAGIGKGFNHRYQLQRFSNSFLRMALKHRTDIVPVLTVNGEFINPLGYRVQWLNRLAQKIGVPFVPVGPLTGLVGIQPWSFYFGMPARLTYVRGRRIRVDELTDTPYEKLTQRELNRIRSGVQNRVQEDLNEAVSQHGRDPYQFEELAENWFENRKRLLYILPSGWPLLFQEHHRLFELNEENPIFRMAHDNLSHIAAILRNPDVLAYHLPFLGWPALLSMKLKLFLGRG